MFTMEATIHMIDLTAEATVKRHWLPTYRWIPIVGGFASFALACAAGANDLPISFATSVGAGALTMLQAVVVSSAMEFTGAAAVGNMTTDARYFNLWRETPPDAGLLMWGFFIVIIAAAISLFVATYLEIPVSSATCIEGALLGINVITRGVGGIFWIKEDASSVLNIGGAVSILLSWTVVPAIAAVIGFLFFGFMKLALLGSQNAEKRTLRAMPFYYGITVVTIILLIIFKAAPRTNLVEMDTGKLVIITGISGILAAVLAYTIVVPLAQKRLGCFYEGRVHESEVEGSNGKIGDISKEDSCCGSSLRDTDVMTAEELFRQFRELRVLETVYEEGDEELGDQSPQITIKCSPVKSFSTSSSFSSMQTRPGQQKLSFGQLLANTPNRLLSYHRIRRPPAKLTRKQRFLKQLHRLRLHTIGYKLEYGRETLVMHALAEKFDEKTEELFSFLQILAAMATAFLQGSIDIAGCMAPYAVLRELYRDRNRFIDIDSGTNPWIDVEEWMIVMGGSGAALGIALLGWKVTRSIGGQIAFMSPTRGFSAQLSLLVAISVGARARLPISIPHTLVGAIVGVGISDSSKNINWRLLFIFVGMWLLTLLASCGLASALYSFTVFSPAYYII